jgi:hypothetical protein
MEGCNMKKSKWKNKFYITIYELAKGGHTNKAIAQMHDVDIATLDAWLKKRPTLRWVMKYARKTNKTKQGSFRDFVYQRLPDDLKRVWNRINRLENEKNGVARIEAMLEDKGKSARQHLFLYAYTTCGFNVSAACRSVNISRKRFEQWCQADPDFHALMDEMIIHKKDFYEGALNKLIDEGHPLAVIFANKTFNKDRGFNTVIQLEHSGNVQHNHNFISFDDIAQFLSDETKIEIAEAYRKLRKQNPDIEIETLAITHNGANGNGSNGKH